MEKHRNLVCIIYIVPLFQRRVISIHHCHHPFVLLFCVFDFAENVRLCLSFSRFLAQNEWFWRA